MKLFGIVLVALACALSASAFAQRPLVPIVDHDVAIATGSGKPVTAEQVREAVLAAGRKLSWNMSPAADGNLVGTLNVRGKHTIAVGIKVTSDRYSVNYINSSNMKYTVEQGSAGAVIHPRYNTWVQTLVAAIDSELRKL